MAGDRDLNINPKSLRVPSFVYSGLDVSGTYALSSHVLLLPRGVLFSNV
jgi:hypothetical protein